MTGGVLSLANSTEFMRHYLISFANFFYFKFKKQFDYKREQNCSSQSCDYGCWQEPPHEILEKIVQNLKLSDRIRSSIVCKSWRSAIMSSIPSQEFPWLVLPQSPDCRNDKTLTFFSLSDGKVVDLKLPKQVQGGWFCGSSKGWLIMVKEQGLNSQMFLLNPISRALHQLPSLATIPRFQKFVHKKDWKLYGATFFFNQVLLSTSNINSDQCVVAATFDSCKELWLCRPGGNSWSVFHPLVHKDECSLAQLLFSNGKLYALIGGMSTKKERTVAQTLIFGDHALELMMVYVDIDRILEPLGETVEFEEYNDHVVYLQSGVYPFLVESSNNEVLLIYRVFDKFMMINNNANEDEEEDNVLEGEDDGDDMEEEGNMDDNDNVGDEEEEGINFDEGENNINDDDDDESWADVHKWDESMYARTSSFHVYNIDSKTDGNNAYSRVQSLGDQMVFLADDGSLSLSATKFKDIEKNCIYFAAKGTRKYVLSKPHTSREIGVFYLETGKVKKSFPSINFSTRSRTSWYIPSF